MELTIHAQIEEEIFYPTVREEIREEDLIDEATVEHQSAKDLIAQIEDEGPEGELFEAKVKVLGEYIKHHVKEEEQPGGMFAKAKKSSMDLIALGEELKWEPSRGGALFPHLYASLPTRLALWARPLPLGPDGKHIFGALEA